jgi:hypothetical protein
MGAGCAERFMSGSARGSGCDSPGLLSFCNAVSDCATTGAISLKASAREVPASTVVRPILPRLEAIFCRAASDSRTTGGSSFQESARFPTAVVAGASLDQAANNLCACLIENQGDHNNIRDQGNLIFSSIVKAVPEQAGPLPGWF